jgi:hypothetical protein
VNVDVHEHADEAAYAGRLAPSESSPENDLGDAVIACVLCDRRCQVLAVDDGEIAAQLV